MKDFERIYALLDISLEKDLINFYLTNTSNIYVNLLENIDNKFVARLNNILLENYSNTHNTFDEINNYIRFSKDYSKISGIKSNYNLVDYILEISNDFIRLLPEPHIDQCKIIDWRSLVHHCGEDIFIVAQLAQSHLSNIKFNWTPIITSDDRRLDMVLSKGISENHNHIYGAAPVCDCNWYILHNKKMSVDKLISLDKVQTDSNNLFRIHMMRAILIRKYFFTKFFYPTNEVNSEYICTEKKKIESFLSINDYTTMLCDFYELNNIPTTFNEKTLNSYDDYAMALCKGENIWEGERALLYYMFLNYNNKKMFNDKDKILMHLYLIYRNEFYSNFIESRKSPGFHVFSLYDENKTMLLSEKDDSLLINYAVRSIKECHIKNYELRITPSRISNINNIIKQLIKSQSYNKNNKKWIDNYYYGNIQDLKKAILNNHLVVHFIKKYEKMKIYDNEIAEPRNYYLRCTLKQNATQLYNYLISSCFSAKFITGIDAANKEINCGPEVFGQCFRYLSQAKYKDFYSDEIKMSLNGLTFHVGEDFIDIPGGLRGIFEAVLFLGLHPGDRLGHAIALGINAEEYYSLKDYTIFKDKQMALDDYVWMIYKLRFLGKLNTLCEDLKYEASRLLNELYCHDSNSVYSLSDYYDSMKLRGDNPEVYKQWYLNQKEVNKNEKIEDFFSKTNFLTPNSYNFYALSNNESVSKSRKNLKAVELYYKYHYCVKTRIEGKKIIKINISSEYVKAISDLQNLCKTRYINGNRLIVEVNLTSNYLIGSYRGYKFSTLYSFNQYKLNDSKNDNIQVCLNTDDSGVFASNLFTEYSILLSILTNKEDHLDDTPKYDIERVYNYIDYLREMSNTFSFYCEGKVNIDFFIKTNLYLD